MQGMQENMVKNNKRINQKCPNTDINKFVLLLRKSAFSYEYMDS